MAGRQLCRGSLVSPGGPIIDHATVLQRGKTVSSTALGRMLPTGQGRRTFLSAQL